MPALLKRFNIDYKSELIGERSITTPSHFAYLKFLKGAIALVRFVQFH